MLTTLEKAARISKEDISHAMAGLGPKQEISPEEVEQFARQTGQRRGKEYARGAGIAGGLLGGGMGIPTGMALAKRRGLGALLGGVGGGLLGGGLGSALGYLRGRQRGLRHGRYFGGVAQEGKLPAYLPEHIPTTEFEQYATGTHPSLAKDLTPAEYGALRRDLESQGFAEGLLTGATSGLEDVQRSLEMGELSGPGAARRIVTPLAEGLAEAEWKRQERKELSKRLLDLYHRGYGHLAERIQASV